MGAKAMTDRDQFAAAVLTGLLANPQGWAVTNTRAAEYAYAIADAMLKERASHEERDEVPRPTTDKET